MMPPQTSLPPPAGGGSRIGPAALLTLAWTRWKLVASIVLLTTAGAFAWSQFVLARDPLFKAAATLDISPSQAQIDYGNAFVRGSVMQSAALLTQTYAEYAMSRPVIETIADRYIAENPEALNRPTGLGIRRTIRMLDTGGPAVRDPRLLFIDNLRKAVDIGTVDGTHLLRIEVKWGDPETAAVFANQIADSLMAEAAERSTGPTGALHDTLAARLTEARAGLEQRQMEAAATRASLGVADIQRQKQTVIDERLAEETRLTNERAQIASSATQVGQLQRQSDGLLSSASPAVEQALALERPRLAGLQQSVRQRAARVGQLESQLNRLSQAETRLGVLDREIEALQAHLAALTERYNSVQLDTLTGAPPIRVVEAATPPMVRDSPRVVANSFMGFIGGCAIAGFLLLLFPGRPSRAESLAETGTEIEPSPPPLPGRVYGGVLRPPSGRAFTAAESREIRGRMGEWLARPLKDPARTFYVLAADRDSDAVAVYNLLAAFLKSRGESVNAEEDRPEGNQLLRTRSRALIYCGGLADSGEIPPPAAEDEDLLLVVRRQARAAEIRVLEERLADAGWSEPYLIRLDR
jgi:uncharacterized protein involved in exopolysaccharide biosynthesis